MKNKNFFYLQYNKINWQNQEKTKINHFVNDFIIAQILSKTNKPCIKIFDMGFGIGFFMKMVHKRLNSHYKNIIIGGCEPSEKNYSCFLKKPLNSKKGLKVKTSNCTFLKTRTNQKFDFITSIYVFPHFISNELEYVTKKIHSMLEPKGTFILVVANEKYLEGKLKSMKDLFIERNIVKLNGKKYWEVLHYSDIPKIGKIIDYNRE